MRTGCVSRLLVRVSVIRRGASSREGDPEIRRCGSTATMHVVSPDLEEIRWSRRRNGPERTGPSLLVGKRHGEQRTTTDLTTKSRTTVRPIYGMDGQRRGAIVVLKELAFSLAQRQKLGGWTPEVIRR